MRTQFTQIRMLLAIAFFVGVGLIITGVTKMLEAAQMAANEILSIPPGVKAVETTGEFLLFVGLAVMIGSLIAVYVTRKE